MYLSRRVLRGYIDPPYNNGKRTWKYNNDYVDAVDWDRHSKWLAMMQRRLALAARLLKPQCSVLIVTVDENEVNRLALILEDAFKGRRIQMVTTVINPKGASLGGDFARVEEYIFFVYVGAARVPPTVRDMLNDDTQGSKPKIPWSNGLVLSGVGRKVSVPTAREPTIPSISTLERSPSTRSARCYRGTRTSKMSRRLRARLRCGLQRTRAASRAGGESVLTKRGNCMN